MKQVGSDDCVGHSGFIFQTEKNKSFGGSGTLAHNDAASDAKPPAVGNITELTGAANAHGIEPFPAVRHGMRSHGKTGAVKISHQALNMIHRLERGRRIGFGKTFE